MAERTKDDTSKPRRGANARGSFHMSTRTITCGIPCATTRAQPQHLEWKAGRQRHSYLPVCNVRRRQKVWRTIFFPKNPWSISSVVLTPGRGAQRSLSIPYVGGNAILFLFGGFNDFGCKQISILISEIANLPIRCHGFLKPA